MSIRERRRHPRYEVEGLTGRLDREHPFEVLRLGLGGVLIKLRRQQEPSLGQLGEVEIDLGRQPLRCSAQVVFVGPDLADDTSRDLFRVGLAFVSPSSATLGRLKRFIEESLEPS
jgi:hypothetical protein